MKGKGKTIFYIFSFLLAILALTTSTFAWIISVKRSSNIIFVTGEVKYQLTGDFKTVDKIVPNFELVNPDTKFEITNLSTIDSELRMQILYQFVDNNPSSNPNNLLQDNWVPFTSSAIGSIGSPNSNNTDKLMGTLSSSDTYKWVYNKFNLNDNMWYYENNNQDLEIKKIIKANEKITIPVIESMFLNGNTTGNNDSLNRNLIIRLAFQAKQHKYVEWNDLGSITVII